MADDGTLYPALVRALTGRSPRNDRTTVPGMVGYLKGKYGTTPPPGLKEHTWRRLRGNPRRRMAASTREAIRSAYQRSRLPQTRAARLRQPGGVPVRISATIRISDDERERTIDVDGWPDDNPPISSLVEELLDAFEAGDQDAMVDAFTDPMEAVVGTTIHFSDVEWITIG